MTHWKLARYIADYIAHEIDEHGASASDIDDAMIYNALEAHAGGADEPELIPDEETEAAHYWDATTAARVAGYKAALADAQALMHAVREGDPEQIAIEYGRLQAKAQHI
jgi:hypothetical protein